MCKAVLNILEIGISEKRVVKIFHDDFRGFHNFCFRKNKSWNNNGNYRNKYTQ